MRELVFKNNKISYDVQLRTSIPGINYPMKLDTGSPITVIPFSILPDLLGKSLMVLIDKVHDFTEHYDTLCFKSYNSDKSDKGIRFVPYLIDDVRIEDVVFPYFLFWVNIDGFELGGNFSSLLFGMDYIIQAKKSFDEKDNFHLKYDDISFQTYHTGFVISNVNSRGERILSIENCADIVKNRN